MPESQKTILFIVDYFDPTKGYISNCLSSNLSPANNVYILAPFSPTLSELLKTNSVESRTLDSIDGIESYKLRNDVVVLLTPTIRLSIGLFFTKLNKILNFYSPDVIQSLITFPSISNLQISLQKKVNCKYFLQDHTSKSVYKFDLRGKIYLFLFRHLLTPIIIAKSEGVICPSPDIIRIVNGCYGVSDKKIIYQPLGTDESIFHFPNDSDLDRANSLKKALGIERNPIVLYVGRLTKDKGTHLLIEACKLISKTKNDVVFLFVGRGEEQFTRAISNLPLGIHLPETPYQNLNLYYWLSNVGVWPLEGSTSIIDAIACGLPVVIRKELEEPERRVYSELLYSEGDVEDLARKILHALDHPIDESTRLGLSQKLLESNSWKFLAEQRFSLYFEPGERV